MNDADTLVMRGGPSRSDADADAQSLRRRASRRALAVLVLGVTLTLAQRVPAQAEPQDPPPTPAEPTAVAPPPTTPATSGLSLHMRPDKDAITRDPAKASPYNGMKITGKAQTYYPAAWGIDRLKVSITSSGNLVRFSFRVVVPSLAKALGDHESTPYLYAPRTNAMLQVPTMEKIGQLRQLGATEVNKDYWMVFSNKGQLVKAGDRVDVIIGRFHAVGLLVE